MSGQTEMCRLHFASVQWGEFASCSYSCPFGPVGVSGDGVGALSSGGMVVLSSGVAMHSPAQSLVPLTVPTSLQPIGGRLYLNDRFAANGRPLGGDSPLGAS